ncbi:hypothetical protein PORY_000991 [Pneumocystis oryctolagi]|uniref:Uncharacterized protein n=1 Tax=Pneumocystis oryctolagi TaxID=42067 RepID=A0ACB7CD71_9ASCO|nr:hypothetical protein PORY_000991 [Pneumocystis oryctolagi]
MKEFGIIYTADFPEKDTYVYSLGLTDDHLVSASSDGALRLWDRETLKMNQISFQAHSNISDMKILGNQSVISCGSDGLVKLWDTRTLAVCAQLKPNKKAPLLSVSGNFEKTMISSGSELLTSDTYLFLWDLRKLSLLFSYTESHNDDIMDVRFHPNLSHLLCSGGCDGLINVFDTRISNEDDAVLHVLNHQSSIHRADFIGPNNIFGLSHMETFSLYNVQNIEEDNAKDTYNSDIHTSTSLGDVRSKLNCNYVIDVIPHYMDETAYLCCGTYNERTSLWLIYCNGNIDEKPYIRLDAHNDALTRCLVFDEQKQIIYTGGEDGKICEHKLLEQEVQTPPVKKVCVFLVKSNIKENQEENENPRKTHLDYAEDLKNAFLPDVSLDFLKGNITADGLYNESLKILNGLSSKSFTTYFVPKKSFSWFFDSLKYFISKFVLIQITSWQDDAYHYEKRVQVIKASSMLKKAAELGNNDALYLLGDMHFYGNYSHPLNMYKAFLFYKELADRTGNATAQLNLGLFYSVGIVNEVPRDQAKALLYFVFSASQGNIRAEMILGYRYYLGIGAPQSCQIAAEYYKRVADKVMNYFDSGPPGGITLPRLPRKFADDKGGIYGEGASVISSGVEYRKKKKLVGKVMRIEKKEMDNYIDYYSYMAEKGDIEAQLLLGKLFYLGTSSMERNFKKSFSYFKRIAKLYWKKNGDPYDEKYGIGAAETARYLGLMYFRGEGVTQNFRVAKIWFQRGINIGDSVCQNAMGMIYLKGYGDTNVDTKKATELFKAASDQGLSSAKVNLAKIYLSQKDYSKAYMLFELAWDKNPVEAAYYLATMSYNELSKESSCQRTVMYYKYVSERIGSIYSTLEEAENAYENNNMHMTLIGSLIAAEQGYEAGQFNLAWLLDKTKSYISRYQTKYFPKSDELSLIYYTRAAKQNNIDAMVRMGDYYLEGIGTKANPSKAIKCFMSAADTGVSALATWNLGWMYENGIGIQQDFHLAKRHYVNALLTSSEAWLPVTLSLIKLRIRSVYKSIMNGTSTNTSDKLGKKGNINIIDRSKNFIKKIHDSLRIDDIDENENILELDYDDQEYYQNKDDFFETIIILLLCLFIAFMIYYRQARLHAGLRQNPNT